MNWAERLEATWPPQRKWRQGDWWLREGAGGGQRVSAASPAGPRALAELDRILAGMQDPLFQLGAEDGPIDLALAARGFVWHDPVVIMATDPQGIAGQPAPCGWPAPPEVQALWAKGKIGAARLAVMDRVQGPKAALWLEHQGQPMAVGFCGIAQDFAGVHAVFVDPACRGQGLGRQLMQGIAQWAVAQGAQQMALAVTLANSAARRLYTRLGMDEIGTSHYRIPARPQTEAQR